MEVYIVKKFLPLFLTFILAISVVFAIPVPAFSETSTQIQEDQQLYDNLADIGSIMKYIKDNYVGDVTYEQLKEAALKGIFSSLMSTVHILQKKSSKILLKILMELLVGQEWSWPKRTEKLL